MNSLHDMGGTMNYGPVHPELDEPIFHADWERKALALTVLMGASGQWNIDQARAARESLPPLRYLSNTYYQIWLDALDRMMLERGLVTADELACGMAAQPGASGVRTLQADAVVPALMRGSPSERAAQSPARFAVGDTVRTLQMHPATHTRLPRYVRDKPGVVTHCHGVHVYPDTNGIGQGEQPHWLYTVQFDARDLWGPDTTASSICVDCWEPYLKSA